MSAAAPAGGSAARTAVTRFEKLPVLIFDDPDVLAYQVARRIAHLIEEKHAAGEHTVLGFPTGSTLVGVYAHLIRMHRERGLDFSNVIVFLIDEYYPIAPDSLQSFYRFMRENLFDSVNIPDENVHAFNAELSRDEIEAHCVWYEHQLHKAGGYDLILLGIGRSGHIGFNEPGSTLETRTRVVTLDQVTRRDAASQFFTEANVPREACTIGVASILEAKEIILLASGEHKAPVVRRAVEEEPNDVVAATFLQFHSDTEVYLDRAAATELTRSKTPWLVGDVDWEATLELRAVVWLSEKLKKPILHLDRSDFHANHLHHLAYRYDSIDALLVRVFEDLRRRIRYPADLPEGKEIILFSPHPDDDVISMGGMLDKLVSNGNAVTVAYMTNGSVAVFDEDVDRHLEFLSLATEILDPDLKESIQPKLQEIHTFLKSKKPGEVDTETVQMLKAYIRYTEAVAGIKVMGLGGADARFLDMPFYRTGRVKKAPIGDADIEIVHELLREKKPAHIFVAGDLSDPHGTHRMCYDAIHEAHVHYKKELESGLNKESKKSPDQVPPLVWLYRGAWQEWDIHRADIFIPLSKTDLRKKIEAIHRHESQKDRVMFQGGFDDREFWERARDRNVGTAKALDALGLPAFHAAEAFVVVEDMPM